VVELESELLGGAGKEEEEEEEEEEDDEDWRVEEANGKEDEEREKGAAAAVAAAVSAVEAQRGEASPEEKELEPEPELLESGVEPANIERYRVWKKERVPVSGEAQPNNQTNERKVKGCWWRSWFGFGFAAAHGLTVQWGLVLLLLGTVQRDPQSVACSQQLTHFANLRDP